MDVGVAASHLDVSRAVELLFPLRQNAFLLDVSSEQFREKRMFGLVARWRDVVRDFWLNVEGIGLTLNYHVMQIL